MMSMCCKLSRVLPAAVACVGLFACASAPAEAGEPAVPVVSSSAAISAVAVDSETPDEAIPEASTERTDAAEVSAEPSAELDAVFHQGRSAVDHCHKRVARDYGRQRGRLKLAVTIDTRGQVARISVLENQATDKMAECLAAAIERWTFPAPSTPITVERLWVFG